MDQVEDLPTGLPVIPKASDWANWQTIGLASAVGMNANVYMLVVTVENSAKKGSTESPASRKPSEQTDV